MIYGDGVCDLREVCVCVYDGKGMRDVYVHRECYLKVDIDRNIVVVIGKEKKKNKRGDAT